MNKLVWVFSVFMLGLCLGSPQVEPSRGTKPRKSKDTLQNNLKDVKSRKNQIVKNLKVTKHQVRAVRHDIRQIDGDLSKLDSSLEQTTNKLHYSRKLQVSVKNELALATTQLAQKKEELRHRLRSLYMRGDASVLAALSRSQSIGQLASRKYVFERIARKDRQLFDEVKALRSEVANRKQRADQLVVRIAGLKKNQESEQVELQDTREEKSQLFNQYRKKQRDLERMVAELESEENDIESQINAYNQGRGKHSGLKPFNGRFLKPVPGAISSGFGMRMHPILKIRRMHKGIDMSAHYGEPIHAAADGIVISARYSSGYGNVVILDHGGGISTLYAHCSRIYVTPGQKVSRGQRIAAVGSTGLSTGPHLHWEVHVNGKAVNPNGRY